MKRIYIIMLGILFTFCSSAQNTVLVKSNRGVNRTVYSKNTLELTTKEKLSSNNELAAYISKIQAAIIQNDQDLISLKESYPGVDIKSRNKFERALKQLEKENKELNDELNMYIDYGVGDWKVFKREFNLSLLPVVSDISYMVSLFVTEDLIAADTK